MELTSRRILIQHPPVPIPNAKLVLILLSFLYFNLFVIPVLVLVVDRKAHLLGLPGWIRERTREIDRRLDPRLREFNRNDCSSGCHDGPDCLRAVASVAEGLIVVAGWILKIEGEGELGRLTRGVTYTR
jgi:hypothetical protein